MSGMAAGSMIEADRRLRDHEVIMRKHKRVTRDAEVWRRYEQDYHITRGSSSSPGDDKIDISKTDE